MPESEDVLLTIDQPYGNHNGGMLAFGPDGYLYIGSGDGGSGGDPFGNGQNLNTLLGKILRIDIDTGQGYGSPSDNPFVNEPDALPEIWDYACATRGVSRSTARPMHCGSVTSARERTRKLTPSLWAPAGAITAGTPWKARHCYVLANCDMNGLTLPVSEYSHELGCSITGGYVYRGIAYPTLVGQYVFSDYCSGTLWAIDAADALASGMAEVTEHGHTTVRPRSFGEDEAGELYLVNGSGQVFQLVAR